MLDGETTAVTVPVVLGGKEHSISASGGIPDGDMELQFLLYGQSPFIQFLSTSLRRINGTSLIVNEALTVPTNDANLDGERSIAVVIGSSDARTIAHGWREWRELRFHNSREELLASPSTYNVALPDYDVSGIGPAHNAVLVATQPEFTYSHGEISISFVEFVIDRIVLDGDGNPLGAIPAMTVRHYGDPGSVTLPIPLTLGEEAYYRYVVRVRKDSGNAFRWNRVGGLCFTTGGISPTVAGVCGL